MRRRLILLSLATTVLVVFAFLVPLALLVSRRAEDGAKVSAQRDAQSVAGVVALASAFGDDPESVESLAGGMPPGTIVSISGVTLGEPRPGQGSLVAEAASSRATVARLVDGGWEIALPVVTGSGVAVVDSLATTAEMRSGVLIAWLLLAVLALVLIGISVWLSDRLGRSLTTGMEDLAASARRLATGELDVRVVLSEPAEIRETGEAFNYLSARLEVLLAEEREEAADLSHRLRTPLTSLRLQAESIDDPTERAEMLVQVNRLEHAVTQVIDLARSRRSEAPGTCQLNEVVSERARFWSLLAEEQSRHVDMKLGDFDGAVELPAESVGVMVDTLIGNVFAHTPVGTPFGLRTFSVEGVPSLEVFDEGPGFMGKDIKRGASASGSTGLGLDIVRKMAETVGGAVKIDNRPGGGAVVGVRLG